MLVPALATADEGAEIPAYELIERYVDQIVINDLTARFGEKAAEACIQTHNMALCLAPGTSQEDADEILRQLPTWEGDDRYNWGGRWTSTATEPSTGGWGNPITLTYSFLNDGTWIPSGGVPGEASSASQLYAEMNSHFGSPAVWKEMFAENFDSWGMHIGITYIEVADDGASFPNSPGVLGSRGDVRIGAHPMDGGYNVLAYNYYPPGGDMVMDTSENWGNAVNDYRFFRNVVKHEHGHGHGLNHVLPTSCTKLMEPNLCTNFDGPRDDDIRGGMRNYGDFQENDDDASTANDLGAFTGDVEIATPSLNDRNDEDWYEFEISQASLLDVLLDPVGSAYQVDGVVVWTYKIQDLQFEIRNGTGGSNVVLLVNDTIEGIDEVLTDYLLSPGTYWLRVFSGPDETSDVQRYDLTMNIQWDDMTSVPNNPPVSGLGMQVYPNPFNPKTSVRLYAPEAGTVSVNVFDVGGSLVRAMDLQASGAGWISHEWNGLDDSGKSVPSGVYFMRAAIGRETETVRAVLLK